MSGVAEPRGWLSLERVTHQYGSFVALSDVSLDVGANEFITLLGPSGCGKTTLLRIVGGFIRPTAGRVFLDGVDLTRLPPHKRPVNMVFQRSTLFPHLDVFENIAFGLRVARVPRPEIESRVHGALALVRLEGFERRRAHELSGGQMQRVALARALVNRPQVLLLDEPLSALDLQIRLEMEVELRRVHRETGAAFVYVTHDQREALALSDRVAVVNHGRLEQVGSPADVYTRPQSPFVARFVGDANVLPVNVTAVAEGRAEVVLAGRTFAVPAEGAARPGRGWLVLRPEAVRVRPRSSDTGVSLPGCVREILFRGKDVSFRIDAEGVLETIKAEAASNGSAGGLSDVAQVGSAVHVTWDPGACRLLPGDDG